MNNYTVMVLRSSSRSIKWRRFSWQAAMDGVQSLQLHLLPCALCSLSQNADPLACTCLCICSDLPVRASTSLRKLVWYGSRSLRYGLTYSSNCSALFALSRRTGRSAAMYLLAMGESESTASIVCRRARQFLPKSVDWRVKNRLFLTSYSSFSPSISFSQPLVAETQVECITIVP
jgi:hypothetical protein